MSFNIIGGGNRVKKRRINHIIQSGEINLCFLQESKLCVIDGNLAALLWGNKDVEWSEIGVVRVGGGIVIFWRKNLLSLNYSFRGDGYVGVNAGWKGVEYNFVNVYSPCNI